jgi:hypothetical protein
MKRKITKIILIVFVAILIITQGTSAFAASNAEEVKKFSGSANVTGSGAIKNIISAVLSVVRTAGAAIAIIILMTIAAKYIMASAGDRADIKKYAVNYVIGAVILFGATGILGIVQEFVAASIK